MPRPRRPQPGPKLHGLTVDETRLLLTGGFSVSSLRRLLDDAVEAEAYEHAALARDLQARYPEGFVVRTPANGPLFDAFGLRPFLHY